MKLSWEAGKDRLRTGLRIRAQRQLVKRGHTPRPRRRDELTFLQFVRLVRPGLKLSKHVLRIIAVLQRVADGELKRVMICLPPRHTKSELVSRLFSAYWLYRYPDQEVGLASYSASLATQLSADARGFYLSAGGALDPSTFAKDDWRTVQGGRMWAEGVGGSLTGKGYHLGIIDDPFKGAKDSNSAVMREQRKEWFQSEFYTRQAPGAAIVIMNTRWHEADLTGWLLAEEDEECKRILRDEEGLPEHWHLVVLPAICDLDDETEYPFSCTVEPDWRQHGEALDPARYPIEALKRFMRRVGEYFWAALYQQRPVPKGAGIFRRGVFRIRTMDEVPPLRLMRVGVDLAFTESDQADFTVAQPGGLDYHGNVWLFEPFRAQVEADDALQGIFRIARQYQATEMGVESVAGQKGIVSLLKTSQFRPSNLKIQGMQPIGDKAFTARWWATLAAQGRIYLVRSPGEFGSKWIEEALKEAEACPRGTHDDWLDAVAILIRLLKGAGLSMPEAVSRDAGMEGTDGRRGLRS